MKIRTVSISFAESNYSNFEKITAITADLAGHENIGEIIRELENKLGNHLVPLAKLNRQQYEVKREYENTLGKLAKIRQEWDATAEFLRTQGVNPDCPSMPQFDKLLTAVKGEQVAVADIIDEEEAEAEFENDEEDENE